jgi:hypothetical protein
MSALSLVVLLLGLFAVPLWLLVAGHRVWRKSPTQRRWFRGMIMGHCLAVVAAVSLSVLPPHMWAPTDVSRGALGIWSLVVLPLLGGILAVVIRPPNRDGAR